MFVSGNFKTQVLNNIFTSVGIGLVLFSSWQYTQRPPSCCKCLSHHNTTCGGNTCSALQMDDVANGVNFHLPPTLNLILVILGLLVGNTWQSLLTQSTIVHTCSMIEIAISSHIAKCIFTKDQLTPQYPIVSL